ncbi:hypothetical protein CPB84DRAFT_1745962 [Gymnopilus junonius]|uniref:Uncharacterized protein n=1 Tax=Gymnopilus junonius TaxID=109634 RepID=A0A9P5NPN2_GYMJU|nr:hypothetical protein CPB84DRAFT_1745962 [Gymnopilus junonius]
MPPNQPVNVQLVHACNFQNQKEIPSWLFALSRLFLTVTVTVTLDSTRLGPAVRRREEKDQRHENSNSKVLGHAPTSSNFEGVLARDVILLDLDCGVKKESSSKPSKQSVPVPLDDRTGFGFWIWLRVWSVELGLGTSSYRLGSSLECGDVDVISQPKRDLGVLDGRKLGVPHTHPPIRPSLYSPFFISDEYGGAGIWVFAVSTVLWEWVRRNWAGTAIQGVGARTDEGSRDKSHPFSSFKLWGWSLFGFLIKNYFPSHPLAFRFLASTIATADLRPLRSVDCVQKVTTSHYQYQGQIHQPTQSHTTPSPASAISESAPVRVPRSLTGSE